MITIDDSLCSHAIDALARSERNLVEARGTYRESMARLRCAAARAIMAEVWVQIADSDAWSPSPPALPRSCPCCQRTYANYMAWARLTWRESNDGFDHRICGCGNELVLPQRLLDRVSKQTEETVPGVESDDYHPVLFRASRGFSWFCVGFFELLLEVIVKTQTIEERYWKKVVKTESCWLWTGTKSSGGYGQIWYGGKMVQAHRLALEWEVGPPPEGKTEAAHSCRNRNCVNPSHSSWATRAENQRDRIRDGTTNRGERSGSAKLSETQVREIRALYAHGDVTQAALGKKFGVSDRQISGIVRGKLWTHLNGEAA